MGLKSCSAKDPGLLAGFDVLERLLLCFFVLLMLCFEGFLTLYDFLVRFQTLVQHLGPDEGLQPLSCKGSSLMKMAEVASLIV